MNRSVWPALVALIVLAACTQADVGASRSPEPSRTPQSTDSAEPTSSSSPAETEAESALLELSWAKPFTLTAPAEWERGPTSSSSTLWISAGVRRSIIFTTQGHETVDEWVDALTSEPRIEVTEPQQVDVGGASGFVMDATASAEAAEGGPGICARTTRCWTIFEDQTGFHSIDEGWTNRIWVLDVDGETVLVLTDAPDAAFEEWIAGVEETLATLEWDR